MPKYVRTLLNVVCLVVGLYLVAVAVVLSGFSRSMGALDGTDPRIRATDVLAGVSGAVLSAGAVVSALRARQTRRGRARGAGDLRP